MKQDKQGHLDRTNKLILLGENVFNQVSPVFEEEEFDDRINLDDSITRKIKNKKEKISNIDNKKEELITKIIGQLYNGTLVEDKLSFRKGVVYPFRCRYKASLNNIKEDILGNLHEVSEKLSKQSLDVLEFMLQKVYTNPNSHIKRNGWSNNNEQRQKVIRFPEIKIIEKSNSGVAERGFNIITLNGFSIGDDGDITFFYEYKESDGEMKTEFPRLETETFAGLYIKFEKEIEENAKAFIQDLDSEILNAEKEIVEITERGQNQLALCELLQGDVNGYAR